MARPPYEDPSSVPQSRAARKEQRAQVDAKHNEERAQPTNYLWQDSALDSGSENPFAETFSPFLSTGTEDGEEKHTTLYSFILAELGEKPAKAKWRYLEVGGPSRRVVMNLPEGLFDETYGMVIADEPRSYKSSAGYKQLQRLDRTRRHKVVEADGTKPESYDALRGKNGTKKFKFIMERLGGGFRKVPIEPYTLYATLNLWYELLEEDGFILAQTPVALNELVSMWTQYVVHESSGKVEVRFARGEHDGMLPNSVMYLKKRKGAPAALPAFPPRVVDFLLKQGIKNAQGS